MGQIHAQPSRQLRVAGGARKANFRASECQEGDSASRLRRGWVVSLCDQHFPGSRLGFCRGTLASLECSDGRRSGNLGARARTAFDVPETWAAKCGSAKIIQQATSKKWSSVTAHRLLPGWILRFREQPCLRDTRGNYRKPGDLLRRTPETEPFMTLSPLSTPVSIQSQPLAPQAARRPRRPDRPGAPAGNPARAVPRPEPARARSRQVVRSP